MNNTGHNNRGTMLPMQHYDLIGYGLISGLIMGIYLSWGYLVPNGGCLRSDKTKLHSMLRCNNDNSSINTTCTDNNDDDKDKDKDKKVLKQNPNCGGTLDTRRKGILLHGGPIDYSGHVVIYGDTDFDLNQTIFRNVNYKVKTMVISEIGVTFFWTEHSQQCIAHQFQQSIVPKLELSASRLLDGTNNQELYKFMTNDCNFSMEHADGSFMDHLKFCYEYSALYFPSYSPRVLLLHSIMGVGTNFFPMEKEQIPKLRALCSKEEFQHIEMFPSILRLIFHGKLLEEMLFRKSKEQLCDELRKIIFYRVIDNERIEIKDMQVFWIQLNYQLIHLLDFLPFTSLKYNLDNPFLQNFILVYKLLVKVDKLLCTIDVHVLEQYINAQRKPSGKQQEQRLGQRITFINTLIKLLLPTSIKLKVTRKQVQQYSSQIGHQLDYDLVFDDNKM